MQSGRDIGGICSCRTSGPRKGTQQLQHKKDEEKTKTEEMSTFGFETQELLDLAIQVEEEERQRRETRELELQQQRASFPGASEDVTVLRAEAEAEAEKLEEADREEDEAAEEAWMELERERQYEEQREKFQKLKEAQQQKKAARVLTWRADWRDVAVEEESRRVRRRAAADWADWTNSQFRARDEVVAKQNAKAFCVWEIEWCSMKSLTNLGVEAGVTVGDRQPVFKIKQRLC